MLVSFTQTYGTGRDELLDIYFSDKKLIELKNHFDQNIYSFHNCEKSTIDKFREMSEGVIKNPVIFEFNTAMYFGREQWFDDGYTKTINNLMNHLRDIGCTHFFFSQDDTFSAADNEDVDLRELMDYIEEHDRDFMISLYHKNTSPDYDGFDPPMEEKKTFNVYETTTWDFAKSIRGLWPMDDGPFICTMDVLEDVYDEEYLDSPLICMAEVHLRNKFTEVKMNRFVTNKKLFQNYNIFGPNSYMGMIWRRILKVNGLL